MNKPICPNCQKERRECEIETQGGSTRCVYCIKRAGEQRHKRIEKSKRYLKFIQELCDELVIDVFRDDDEMQAVIWENLEEIKNREAERIGKG